MIHISFHKVFLGIYSIIPETHPTGFRLPSTNDKTCSLSGCFLQAEEILEQFLREKSLEKNSILQADKKLTENEKKIHGKSKI